MRNHSRMRNGLITAISLVVLLFLLAGLPGMLFGEGFYGGAPYGGAEPIGKYDGQKVMSCGTPEREGKVTGPVVVPQAGGSAFTPPVQP